MTASLRTLLAALTLMLASLSVAPAQGQSASEAEAFVAENAQDVISTLRALDAGEVQLDSVRASFRERITELADVDRITNFVLGRYRRGADEVQLAEFRDVFREYAFSVYENELTNYAGQTLEVRGSVERRPGDYIVETVVAGGPDGQVYEVNWRVLDGETGGLRVVDVQVAGIWLAQTQRDQIISVIGNHRGEISAATDLLRSRLRTSDLPGPAGLGG